MNRKEWIETVLREVRFAPDRRKIRQELLEHMEDRMEEYMEDMECSMDSESEAADGDSTNFGSLIAEAEARVLASMGDPVELGQDLNRQHKPWLGWLWLGSRVVLAAAVLVVMVLLFCLWVITPAENSNLMNLEEEYLQMARHYDMDYNRSGNIYYNIEPDYTVQLQDTEITFRNLAYDDYDGRLEMLVTSRGAADLQNIALDFCCNGEKPTMFQTENGRDKEDFVVGLYKITFERFDRDAETLQITYNKFGEHFEFTVDVKTGAVM